MVVDEMNRGIYHFPQIVRSDIGRHADGNAERAVQKQIRHGGRKNCWLFRVPS